MALTIDQMFDKIGSFGRYQLLLLLAFNLLIFFWFGWPVIIMTFLTAEPNWRCVANSSLCPFNDTFSPSASKSEDYKYRCNIPRSEWTFTDDLTSVVTEFDLVCDNAIYAYVASSMIFAGFLLGGLAVGPFADKLGRRHTIYFFGAIVGIFSLLTAFPHAFWLFGAFRFLIGFGVGGSSIGIYVLATEMVGARHRSLIGVSLWYGWTAALVVLAGIAYLIRDWRTLAIVCGVPAIPLCLGWFITRESPRWLLLKGKVEDAEVVLKKVAQVNRKEMPKEPLYFCNNNTIRMGDIRDLFSSWKMTHKTLVSWYLWFVVGMVYYGVSLSSPTVGGNMYLNFFLSSLIEFFCYHPTVWAGNRFGRKKVICAGLILAALSSVGSVLLTRENQEDQGMLIGKIIMSMILAKVFIVFAFNLAYVYSAELFPTVIRNVGMGTSTAAARVGAFCSPYIVYLNQIHHVLPYSVMGANALLCGLLCLTLPETANKPTLETIDGDLKNNNPEEKGQKEQEGQDGKEAGGDKDPLMPGSLNIVSAV